MRRTDQKQHERIALMVSARGLEMIQRLVILVEAARCAVLRERMLSVIFIYLFVNLWLGAAFGQAQESPSYRSGIAVTQYPIGRPSVGNAEASDLVLSMVDRREIEANSPPSSLVQPANTHSTDLHSAEKVLIPAESRGSEYASLAGLASAPPSSLLSAVQGKSAGRADAGSSASGDKTLLYRLGALDFVVNGLPNNFSVSSAGNGVAGTR